MELSNTGENLKATTKLSFPAGEYFAKFLINILRFNKLNKVYEQIASKEGIDFIDELIRILELKIELDPRELNRIPKEGPFIIVANHPLGGLEGLLLVKHLHAIRPDLKLVVDSLINKVEPVSRFFMGELSSEKSKDQEKKRQNELDRHLKNGGGLCIFPNTGAGSYGSIHLQEDRIWHPGMVRFVKKAEVPVVPVCFQGTYNRWFHLVGKIFPALQQGSNSTEILSRKNKTIKIRIGNTIVPEEQRKFREAHQFGRFLRAKIYSLGSKLEVKRFFNYSIKPGTKPQDIAEPVSMELILSDLERIKQDYTLYAIKNYTAFCAPARLIPNILNEIGRLREITFRDVGEGTNMSSDLDEFDLYYNQMFIWDEEQEKIVGAYRLGLGGDIMEQHGKRGFYLHTLFRINRKFDPLLKECLELGRSFVVKEYQRKPLPLFLLWKGILYFLLKNPEYRYLVGPVSISNNYSNVSKELIIRFIMNNHMNRKMAAMIKPRHGFKFKSDEDDIHVLTENMDHDINRLDKTIGEVDELNPGLPVLLKKYIKLNAKIIGFNVDPKFNNCLDGLIVLDVYDVPKSTIESLSKEANDGSILNRFYNHRE